MSDAPYSARMTKPSNPQHAPKKHGRRPPQPGYQGKTRPLSSEFPCAIVALVVLTGALAPMLAGAAWALS